MNIYYFNSKTNQKFVKNLKDIDIKPLSSIHKNSIVLSGALEHRHLTYICEGAINLDLLLYDNAPGVDKFGDSLDYCNYVPRLLNSGINISIVGSEQGFVIWEDKKNDGVTYVTSNELHKNFDKALDKALSNLKHDIYLSININNIKPGKINGLDYSGSSPKYSLAPGALSLSDFTKFVEIVKKRKNIVFADIYGYSLRNPGDPLLVKKIIQELI